MELFRYKIRALFIAHDALIKPLWEQLSGYCDVIPSPGERCEESALSACISINVPDIVVLQLTSDVEKHCRHIRHIRAVSPHTHVVMIADRDASAAISRALQAGAIGYVYRDEMETGLIEALQAAMQERGMLDSAVAMEILTYFQADYAHALALTGRERRILRALAQGMSYADIARCEYIPLSIVHSHSGNIILKMSQAVSESMYAALTPQTINPIPPMPMIAGWWQQSATKSLYTLQTPSLIFILALCSCMLDELRLRHASLEICHWRAVMRLRALLL